MSHSRSLLFIGATGYIGGTILSSLTDSSQAATGDLSITAVVRKESQAKLLKEKGIQAVVLSGGLDDTKGLTELARQHDIVLNGATGFHGSSARAFIEGLAQRREASDTEVFYIHLSGTSNLSVGGVSGRGGELRTFSDNEDGIYEYEVEREASDPYRQRTSDVTVVETGEKLGVRTYIIMPPLVWGTGTGLFHRVSHQIPELIQNAAQSKQLEYISPGTSTLGHVHVTDLAALFKTVLINAIKNPSLPAGRKGFFFANTGSHAWLEVAQRLAKAGNELGHLKSPVPVGVSLTEIAAKLYDGDEVQAERVHASSSSSVAVKSYELGWTPVKTEEDWQAYGVEAFRTTLG
ncbi:hypothetical protein NW762_006545 [Fusarium torreyae]|uniref:NAD-dependent epimerase/dehydratase domain-containing protein n=1 Tax=Fusarium torreyae TaxID=1237075 RepID=A0A9W8RZ35_9HYPO|nr:hypothetical protein NW762_006545 [Fusarium torreyae]